MAAAAAAAAEEAMMLTAEVQSEMQRKNEIYLARRQNNGVPGSLEELRLGYLNHGCSGASTMVSEGGVGVVEATNAALGNRSAIGEFYEHGFNPEFCFRVRFQKIGAGLENLGNTCYLNSVLQCLTYTEPFVAYLLSGNHESTCRKAGFCAMCALQNHVMDALQSTGKILRPFHLVKNLRCISSNFRNYRQEDAHEYMVNLLESMHKCCLPYGISSESPSAYEKSQVHKIFGGQLRSQVKCMQCSYCSNKFDPFLDLSLEIMKADSLRKALTHFTAMELLDGGERQFQCQHCKEKVMAFKQLTIHKAPYVLTIHLKRFDSSIDGEKLSKKIEYGPTLNLNPYISDPRDGDYRYTLYGVLVHTGWTIYSGHYFCYVRTSAGKWYSLDDNQVTKVSEKTVLSREAYMLFYVRDRTLGVKGAIEVTPKPDISIPSATVHGSVQTKHDGIHSELVPAIDASLQQSMKVEGLLFHVTEQFETKCLQGGDDICTNGHQIASSQELAKPILSIDSKLPSDSDKKGNATDENAQDSASVNMMEIDHSPLRDDFENSLRQPNSTSDFIQTEAVGTTLVDNRNNGSNSHEFESCSNNMQLPDGGHNFPKLLETRPVESFLSFTTVSCVQQETHTDIITENLLYNSHRPKSKLKKLRKSSSINGQYFGRKKLFLMSLHLPKNKQMRSRKHHLGSRKKFRKRIDDDPITDSLGASTSEIFQTIDTCFSHLPRKHSRSTHRKSKGKKGIKLGSTSVHDEAFNGGMRTFMLEASNKSSRFCSSEGDDYSVKCRNAENTDNRKFPTNLQMESLKQASVNVWDDENFSAKQMNEIKNNSKRKFGCLLDECDEEDYDKSERKRLKRSRQLCWSCWAEHITVDSHLQNIAEEIRTKVKAKEPGNQPFRILT